YESEVAVQQVIVETEALVNDLIKVDADSLQQQIDATGKALIYGIYFDTGKAVVKPESKETLDAIATLLKRNSALLLYVVGHTDDTGTRESNLTLSQQRSAAAVETLVKDYGIAANRLLAQGVGPYTPAASNDHETGRQKNRPEELVKRLQYTFRAGWQEASPSHPQHQDRFQTAGLVSPAPCRSAYRPYPRSPEARVPAPPYRSSPAPGPAD